MKADAELFARIPAEPGVYLMKDKRGRVIYVGKAKDLRARVKAYFSPKGTDERAFVATGMLGRLLGDLETIVVTNEKEALLLENHLIKEHQPRFNVKLIDDKNYLVLRVDPKGKFPRVEVGRRIKDDDALYFGPYHSATSCRATLRLINRHFQLRTCTDHVLENRGRPCLLYQIKRCPAPCVLPIDPKTYGEQVQDAVQFLSGKTDELAGRLRGRMKEHARTEEYERAGQLRDQLEAVEKTLTGQAIVANDFLDQDVIGFSRQDDLVEVAVLFVRQGKVLGRRVFQLKDQEVPDGEVVRNFLRSYYELGTFVPDEVLLPVEPVGVDELETLATWLREIRGRKVEVLCPQRGSKMKLLELARRNAEASRVSRKGRGDDSLAALEKLKARLELRRLPRRIECFDVAHIQGSATVAAMVVFIDGEPAPALYRTFKVKVAENDDFASMYEVLSRRFRRLKAARDGVVEAGEDVAEQVEAKKAAGRSSARRGAAAGAPAVSDWLEPDLLVIDGGKGQLGTALAAMRDVGIEATGEDAFDVIGLAKEREDKGGTNQPDRVFLRNVKDPIRLKPSSTELYLLARIRDEAHRVANGFHRRLRKKRTLRSALEEVPGVGAKRQRELLKHFGSLKRVRAATLDELAAAPGMNRKAAVAVRGYFDGGASSSASPPPDADASSTGDATPPSAAPPEVSAAGNTRGDG